MTVQYQVKLVLLCLTVYSVRNFGLDVFTWLSCAIEVSVTSC